MSVLILFLDSPFSRLQLHNYCGLLVAHTGRGVDPGGQLLPNENIGGGGGKHRFAPRPPNNFDNLKNL